MNNPECNRIERDLENKCAPPSINSTGNATFNFYKLTRQVSEVILAKLPTKKYLNRNANKHWSVFHYFNTEYLRNSYKVLRQPTLARNPN